MIRQAARIATGKCRDADCPHLVLLLSDERGEVFALAHFNVAVARTIAAELTAAAADLERGGALNG